MGGQDDPERRPEGQLGAQAGGDGLEVSRGAREQSLQLADQSGGGLGLGLAQEAQRPGFARRADQPDGVARARDQGKARARLAGPAQGRLPVAGKAGDAGQRRAAVGQRDEPVQKIRMNGRAREGHGEHGERAAQQRLGLQPGPGRGSPRDGARRHAQGHWTSHGEIDLDTLAEAQAEVGAAMKHRGERREVPDGTPTTRAAELDPLGDWTQERDDGLHEPRLAIHRVPCETERRLARGAIGCVYRRPGGE